MHVLRTTGSRTLMMLMLMLLVGCGAAAPTTDTTSGNTAANSPTASSAAPDDVAASAAPASSAAANATAESSATDGNTAASDEIPVYPGAEIVEENSALGQIMSTAKQQAQQQQNNVNVTIDGYTLPEGTTFEQISTFYNDALTANGWKETATQPVQAGQDGGSASWLKDNNEVLMVVMMPNLDGQGNSVLMVTHGTPK